MFDKLSFENIANRFTEAYSSLQGLAKGQISNFFTPVFNSGRGQQAAINDLTGKFVEGQVAQDDKFAQQAKDLIQKHISSNLLSFGRIDTQSLGMELAERVPQGARLGDAVFAQLSPGDRADTARVMIDNLLPDQLKSIATTASGKAMLRHAAGLLDGNTTSLYDLGFSATGDTNRQQRIGRAFGISVNQPTKTQEVSAAKNNPDFKPITKEQLLIVAPTLKRNPAKLENVTQKLNESMQRFKINSPVQQAQYLATVAEESGEFKFMEELPSKYASSKLLYKGRGPIQITHEDNYRQAGEALGVGDLLVKNPKLLATDQYAYLSAGWFYGEKKSGQYRETPNSRIGNEPKADLWIFAKAPVSSTAVSATVLSIIGEPDCNIMTAV